MFAKTGSISFQNIQYELDYPVGSAVSSTDAAVQALSNPFSLQDLRGKMHAPVNQGFTGVYEHSSTGTFALDVDNYFKGYDVCCRGSKVAWATTTTVYVGDLPTDDLGTGTVSNVKSIQLASNYPIPLRVHMNSDGSRMVVTGKIFESSGLGYTIYDIASDNTISGVVSTAQPATLDAHGSKGYLSGDGNYLYAVGRGYTYSYSITGNFVSTPVLASYSSNNNIRVNGGECTSVNLYNIDGSTLRKLVPGSSSFTTILDVSSSGLILSCIGRGDGDEVIIGANGNSAPLKIFIYNETSNTITEVLAPTAPPAGYPVSISKHNDFIAVAMGTSSGIMILRKYNNQDPGYRSVGTLDVNDVASFGVTQTNENAFVAWSDNGLIVGLPNFSVGKYSNTWYPMNSPVGAVLFYKY